ncbi:BTAD domain-containing putative transcriptional regulator [Actinoplanes sp. ATCC 53533]|uniref:BTAD domain-containing putative transcriptional regulator n=1 Tax=Actinoplanes sp. ATCC 53533 TaxID=1288362 RepID=UPI0013150FD1|nr:BTAD domain-containing putative transcriptional regulator [Actinoplanes sp. ATCC 53533]
MRVRLLGPIDLVADGRPVVVAGFRRKALLAVLALHAGEIVGTERLIDMVWPDKAGRTGLNTVQSHMSYLRRLFGVASAVLASPPGYRLNLPDEPTDVVVAERLIRAGREAPDPRRRAALLGEALGMWRGRPLLDVAQVPWLAGQADRLATLESETRRALIDARLTLGEHTAVLPELGQVAAQRPFDEQVQAQLVLALYRAGRQAEALAVLRDIRARLVTELGIDPGPALRSLEEAVLRQDPALVPPAVPVPVSVVPPPRPTPNRAQLPGSGPPLAGRAGQVAALDRLLAGLGAGVPPVVLVTGDPGIGKTRLLGELARRAERDGRLVLWGRTAEFEQEVPFAPVRNALGDHLAEAQPASFAELSTEDLRLVREVLPTLAGPAADEASRRVLTAERYRLHRALRGVLEALAQPAGLVFILDDVHWADHGSVEWLDHLLRHPPRGPVLVAVAYRPRQVSGAFRQALGRASQDGVAEVLELGPLTFAEADGLLPVRLDRARRRRLYDLSTGNPFYLQALARADPASDSAGPGADDDALPPAVLSALAAELDALTPVETQVAWAAAVAGDLTEPGIIAGTADLPVAEVLGALDGLVARDLLRPVPRTGRFQFRHPLLRRVTYDAAGAGWRVAAHDRAAAVLRQQGAPAIEQAPHVERSERRGDRHAVGILREAAAAALHSSPAAAAHWLGAALRIIPDDVAAMPARLELLTMRAQALSLGGRLVQSRDALHDLLRLVPAEAAGMRAEVVINCAGTERQLRRHREANALLRTELAKLADREGRAAVRMMLGVASGRIQGGLAGDGREWPRRALRAARRLGDRGLMTCALVECVLADQASGDLGEHTGDCLDEAASLVDAMPDAELAASLPIAVWLPAAETAHERMSDALRHLDRALEVARKTGQTYVIGGVHVLRANTLVLIGDLGGATRALEDGRDAAVLAGTDGPLCAALALRSQTAALRGDLEGALGSGKEALRLIGERPDYFSGAAMPALASAHLLAGDAAACGDLLAGGPERYVTTPLVRSTWFETLAGAAAAAGDHGAATGWADRAHAEAQSWGTPRREGFAELARAHALRAADPRTAAAHALTAGRLFTVGGDRISSGRAQLAAGLALAAGGEPEQARRALVMARALFDLCDAHLLSARASREERRLGSAAHQSG